MQQRKGFCIGMQLEIRAGYSTKIPRKYSTLYTVSRCHRTQHQPKAEYPWIEGPAVYLVRAKGTIYYEVLHTERPVIPLRAIGVS